jgi:hypothetical protein
LKGKQTSERLETEVFDVFGGIGQGVICLVVVLDEMDEIEDGEHASKGRFVAVPEGSGDDAWQRKR